MSLVVMVSGCVSDQWQSNKTYSDNGVNFTYPGTWQGEASPGYSPSNSTSIATVGNEDYGFAMGTVNTQLSGSDLQQVLNQMIQQYKSEPGFISEKNMTVDGVTATEVVTNGSSQNLTSQISYVFWIKNDNLFFVVYSSNNNETQTLDRILSTVKTS